jgi:cytochrome c-type biogenesis protein CcmE
MNKRSRRKVLVLAIVFGVATATVLGLTAFEENLLYFYSPTQVKTG